MPRVVRKATKARVAQPVACSTPQGSTAWNALLRKVVAHLEKGGDQKRAEAFKTALSQGRAERLLRQYGVIRETDILREFPFPDSK
jgi:hypothetical protein